MKGPLVTEVVDVEVFNPERRGTLVGFALASQVEQSGQKQQTIAANAGLTAARVSDLVHWRTAQVNEDLTVRPSRVSENLTVRQGQLTNLQDALAANEPGFEDASLVTFHGRLYPGIRSDVVVPSRWADHLVNKPPRSIVELLLAAEAVFSLVERGANRERTRRLLDQVLDHLLVAAGLPPGDGTEAMQLLARFADHVSVVRQVLDRLEAALRLSPTGYRALRVISMILYRVSWRNERGESRPKGAPTLKYLEGAIGNLFTTRLAANNANPSRSLDIEAAAAAPPAWEWPTEYLKHRAIDLQATPRERGYAALALWRRCGFRPEPLAEVLASFDGVDPESHLGWVRTNLQMSLAETNAAGDGLSNKAAYKLLANFPEDAPAYQIVWRQAEQCLSEEFGIGERCVPGARKLFVSGVLSNEGVVRMRALDTMRVAFITGPVAIALANIAKADDVLPWLQERACFALGFLGRRDGVVENALEHNLPDALPAESADELGTIEAAAWAAGDTWASDTGTEIPAWLPERLSRLAISYNKAGDLNHLRITRAAAYGLAVTGARGNDKYLRELSGKLHDPIASRLARWGVNRYNNQGLPCPLLDMELTVAEQPRLR
jgi:hypothetical protein